MRSILHKLIIGLIAFGFPVLGLHGEEKEKEKAAQTLLEVGKASIDSASGTSYPGLAVRGKWAFVADGGLRVFDISSDTPVKVAEFGIRSHGIDYGVHTLYAWGHYIYGVHLGNQVAKIFDVSDPVHPRLVSKFNTGHEPRWGFARFIARGIHGFISSGDTLRIYNFSNPATPILLSTTRLPETRAGGSVTGLVVRGNNLYHSRRSNLAIYDISKPEKPKLVFSKDLFTVTPGGIAVQKNILYAGGIYGWFEIFDISNPQDPRRLSRINSGFGKKGGAYHIGPRSLKKGYLFAVQDRDSSGGGEDVITVLDVRDPRNPKVVTNVKTYMKPVGLALWGNRVFVSNEINPSNLAAYKWVGDEKR